MNFKYFNTGAMDYVLDINNSLIFQIDDLHKEIISVIEGKDALDNVFLKFKNKYSTHEINQAIQDIKDIISDGKEFINDFKYRIGEQKYSLESISLILTNACNFACKYCYNDGDSRTDNMTSKVAKDAVDFLIKNSDNENITIIYFGGEPLLNKDIIEEIVEYSKEQGIAHNKKVHFSITTNATFLDEKLKKILVENNCHFNISIDGDENTHNRCRVYKSGVGTYKDVLKGIDNIPVIQRTARGTVTHNNLDIYKLHKHLSKIGFENIHFEMVSTEDDKLKITDEDIQEIINSYRKICCELLEGIYDGVLDKKYPIYGQIKDDLEKLDRQTIRAYFCKASKNYVAIDTDGSIYPCHRYIGDAKYKIGNIKSGFYESNQKYLSSTVFSKKQCLECWARYLCGGGCYHEAEILNNDVLQPNQQKCKLTRGMLEESMKLYLRLIESGVEDVSQLYE